MIAAFSAAISASDARDHRDLRRAHRRRVEAPAETDLEHRHVDGFAGEVVEGQRRRRFEHRRVEPRHQRPEGLDAVDHAVFGDGLSVDADALAERDEVRRGVQADAVASGLEDRGEHRRHRALAVGAADLDQPVPLLGAAQRVEEPLDPVEPLAHARVLAAPEGEQPGDGLGVRHRRPTPIGAAGQRRTRECGGASL